MCCDFVHKVVATFVHKVVATFVHKVVATFVILRKTQRHTAINIQKSLCKGDVTLSDLKEN